MSPTQRSLKYLRAIGYNCQVVEYWNPFARIRQDLFGCIDILAIKPGVILGVQTTSGSHLAARAKKAAASAEISLWMETGAYFEVHGWSKVGPRGKRKTWALNVVCHNQIKQMRKAIFEEPPNVR